MTSGRDVIFIGNNEKTLITLLNANIKLLAAIHEKEHDLQFCPATIRLLSTRAVPEIAIEKNSRPALAAALTNIPAADLFVVSVFGILPDAILKRPRLGCLNIHPSLLPEYKGPYPVQWCLINGERQSGVTFMKLDSGIDTGGVYRTVPLEITDADDTRTIMDRQDRLIDEHLEDVVHGILTGELKAMPQTEPGSYFPKLTAEIRFVNFRLMTARMVHNITRSQVRYGGGGRNLVSTSVGGRTFDH